jgi:hypothetical protein
MPHSVNFNTSKELLQQAPRLEGLRVQLLQQPSGAGSPVSSTTTTSHAGSCSSSSTAEQLWCAQAAQVVMGCFAGYGPQHSSRRAVSGSGSCCACHRHSVLPPGVQLLKGPLLQLLRCGVEMWPASVAARLQCYQCACGCLGGPTTKWSSSCTFDSSDGLHCGLAALGGRRVHLPAANPYQQGTHLL